LGTDIWDVKAVTSIIVATIVTVNDVASHRSPVLVFAYFVENKFSRAFLGVANIATAFGKGILVLPQLVSSHETDCVAWRCLALP
jgi:hypothetical protein